MSDESNTDRSDDPLESLFAGVERRPQPSDQARQRAFEAVTEEWEAAWERRTNIVRFVPLAVAATLLLGVVGLVMTMLPVSSTHALELAQGHIHVESVVYRAVQQPVVVELSDRSSVKAIESTRWVAGDSADVRLAKGSEFTWLTPAKLALHRGNAYVITDGRTPFSVKTAHGLITDIGTEFLVEINQGDLMVAVREGRIELATDTETRQTSPVDLGQASVFELTGDTIVERTEAASHERWNWVHITSIGYTSTDPVTMFRTIAKDLGKQLRFEHGVEARLRVEELHGDYRGMTPWAAFEQVLRVTDTRSDEANDIITISLNN